MWPANKKIRVMVIDDSMLARKMIVDGRSEERRVGNEC